jgi:tetratricopeptide (TPR) repeat protein
LLDGQGKFDEAERLYHRALVTLRRHHGPGHPEVAVVLNNLADNHQARDDTPAAERLYRRALAIKERALGREHPDVALTLHNLGVLRGARGDRASAMALFERALVIATAALGATHPLVAACRDHLAGLLRPPRGPGARPRKPGAGRAAASVGP